MEADTRRHPLLVGTIVAIVALVVAFGAAAAVAAMRDDEPEARPVDAELRFLPEDDESDNPLESGDATGTPVPETTWEKLDGSGLGSFADYEGKPVVVNFFGSWCTPCRKEMPAFQEVYEDIGDEVAFLGLAVQESARDSQAFVEEMGTTYDIGRDPSGKILTHFGVVNFPSTYLVSPDGKIIAARAGELDAKELRELVADDLPVIDVPLAYAFTAGLVAAVNPCGFPMLPAYLSFFIGTDDEAVDRGSRVPRALYSALAVSLGFLAVFAVLGIPIRAGVSSIYEWMPWFTMVIGAALVGLGIAMFAGYRLKVALPRLDRGGSSRRFSSMVLFGVSYAIASLSCTLPIFLSYVSGTASRSNWLSGLLAFLAYGAGMSLVLLVLSLALALARDGMIRRMRSILQYVDRIAAALLVLVGVYLVYYGIHAVESGDSSSSGVGLVQEWSDQLSAWLQEGGVALGVAFAVLVAAGAAWAVARRPRRP